MPESPDKPQPSEADHSILNGLKVDELFARGMQSVKMTGAGGMTQWTPPTVDEARRLFPNHEILEIIGRGGMGAVYKARQLALDRVVAIKLLPLEISVDQDFAERFKREARTMAKMNHPNIVSVFDFGTTPEGHLFFIMEFVEGATLHHLIKTIGLKPAQALEIIVGVCEALNYAHTEGVVHRDVKPANVLVDVKGRVKVTDFGLARLNNSNAAEQAGYTMTGTILGTPDYMAPEQKRGMHVDHRADIYSLGVMFYEMLCGQVPQGVFDLPSRLISVDERVDQVVIRAMQQEPDRRYQNTAEMKHEVQTINFPKDPHAKAPQPRLAETAPSRRNAIWMAAAAVAILLSGGIFYFKRGAPPLVSHAPPISPALPQIETAPPVAPTSPIPELPTAPTGTAANPETKPPEPSPTPIPQPPPTTHSPVATSEMQPQQPKQPVETKPSRNPELALEVAQLDPDNKKEMASNEPSPATALQEWERLSDHANILIKRRDPDRAIEALENAIEATAKSARPVRPGQLADLYFKLGSLEAGIGSVSTARGTLEEGKRILLEARSNGKLGASEIELLGNIEGSLRRLPFE